MKLTRIEHCDGAVYRRFEHETRGTVETLTYRGGRLIYVASGLGGQEPLADKSSAKQCKRQRKPRPGSMWKRAAGDAQ